MLKDLIRKSDMVLENFRPGVIDEMGFGFEALQAIKPDIILVSVSGFGQYGPYRDRPAFDPLGQAMSGLMALATPPSSRPSYQEELSTWCERHTVAEICDTLAALGIAVGPVQSIPEVARDPHVWARETIVKVPDPLIGENFVPGLGIKFSAARGAIGPVPRPGQHTDDVLSGLLGYTDEQIQALHAGGIV